MSLVTIFLFHVTTVQTDMSRVVQPVQCINEEDGLVVVDQSICVGCRYCVALPVWRPQFDEKKKLMSKCDGCYERVAKG